jgi:hypothetical protein
MVTQAFTSMREVQADIMEKVGGSCQYVSAQSRFFEVPPMNGIEAPIIRVKPIPLVPLSGRMSPHD